MTFKNSSFLFSNVKAAERYDWFESHLCNKIILMYLAIFIFCHSTFWSHPLDQILRVYNGPSTDVPLIVCALFLCTFYVFHRGNLHFFMLYFSYVALLPCFTSFFCSNFFMMHFFRVALFLCIAIFHVALLYVTMFSFCILLLLHYSHAAIFPCCNLLMLNYFQRCSQEHHKHLRWRALQQQLTKPLTLSGPRGDKSSPFHIKSS